MSYYWSRKVIQNYAASTSPYIRGHCDEICDHLLMLTEAYKPPMVKTGDLESKFPGYARAAREASDIFETWFDELEYIFERLIEFEDGVQVTTYPRIEDDGEPGDVANAHLCYLVNTRDYPMRFGMTAEETRMVDGRECKQRVGEAVYFFRDAQQEAIGLSEKYLALLNEAGYDGDVFADDVESSLPTRVWLPRIRKAQEDDTMSGGDDDRIKAGFANMVMR